MVDIQSGGIYKLINAKAGNCADLSGGDDTSVIGFDYHGGENQKVRPQRSWTTSPMLTLPIHPVAFREAA